MEKTLPASGAFAVVFTYSWSKDAAVYLFDTEQEATDFLRGSYEAEVESDKENGWHCLSSHEPDWSYAYLRNFYRNLGDAEDVTEMRVVSVYCNDKQETHPKTVLDAFVEDEVPSRLKHILDVADPSEDLIATCIQAIQSKIENYIDYDAIDRKLEDILSSQAEGNASVKEEASDEDSASEHSPAGEGAQMLRVPVKGGSLVAAQTPDPDYPGICVEYVAEEPDANAVSDPCVLVEYPNEPGSALRALIWSDPKSEDYTKAITLKGEN